MEDEYEEVLAKLTDSQKEWLIQRAKSDLWVPPPESDLVHLLSLGLLEYPEPMHHRESHSGNRQTDTPRGVPRLSGPGKELAARLRRHQK